ncbi:putative disease resistance protein RGA3 [Telopea speciosissima]|uniref:putative disease resistance protein RGA3 n=1 Tax=Telopea speciosissima TaxID=54955 RepID=UPI001CC658E1|nr:putative disease resistance protein RGA3 [Telopea speciosissima]
MVVMQRIWVLQVVRMGYDGSDGCYGGYAVGDVDFTVAGAGENIEKMVQQLVGAEGSNTDTIFPLFDLELHHLIQLHQLTTPMADTPVSKVLQQLNSIIQQQNDQELRLVSGVKEEVNKLSATLKDIQSVLEDAEEKQMRDKDVKIKEIRKRLDSLANEKGKYCLVEERNMVKELEEEAQQYYLKSTTWSMTNGDVSDDDHHNQIYGQDTDKDIIISQLLSESSQQEGIGLHVISIVGMGGLGKTTLAQLVFNDNKVTSHFEKRLWVRVSRSFDARKIAKAIIEAINGGESSSAAPLSLAWESFQLHLYNSIKGRRFLLVLDNIWIEDHRKWGALKFSLNYGALGSRILVTTRSEKVALTMGAINPYHSQPLSNDHCFLLFSHLALAGREEKELKQYEEIGKEIAKKCRGVPLAAKILGCLMRLKSTRQDWLDILESETWKFQESVLLPALLLTYYDLPSPIKCCFAFCAIFPKDHWIHKDNLIKLWMSQGFLGIDGRKELELIGVDFFDNLVICSFFQDLRKDKDGHIYCCKMHDLVHDLAQFITDKECFIIDMKKSDNTGDQLYYNKKFCRLSLLSGEEVMYSIPVSLHSVKVLHTLKLFGEISVITLPPILFSYLTCLRALDLSKTKLTELPSEVVKLIHLRYLDLSMTDIKELPETLSELCNLQTLKLDNCEYLSKLPQRIGKLINLRHLEIENTVCLNRLPQEIGRLTSLRTLSRFFASEGCRIGELKNLNLIRGRLEITRLKRVANKSESFEAGLKNKKDVHSLVLEFSDDSVGMSKEVERMEGVLQGLEPHPNLVKLSIF